MGELWQTEEVGDGIVLARFDDPPMSYFTGAAGAELRSLVRRWRHASVRCVIVTGGDGRFITHYAVEEIVELARTPDRARALGAVLAEGFQDLLQEIADLEKPVIAAISGDAMGGGLELSLACDIRIAQHGDFRIGFPEAALGILAGGGGTQRLARTIGQGAALDMLLRSRVVAPEEALRLGIVSEVAKDCVSRAMAIAAGMMRAPAAALAQAKLAVRRGADQPLPAALRLEAEAWLATVVAGTAAEVMDDFLAQPLEARRAWIEAHGAN
jgi:enoyl-CoA hydratase/carnithine racemase